MIYGEPEAIADKPRARERLASYLVLHSKVEKIIY